MLRASTIGEPERCDQCEDVNQNEHGGTPFRQRVPDMPHGICPRAWARFYAESSVPLSDALGRVATPSGHLVKNEQNRFG